MIVDRILPEDVLYSYLNTGLKPRKDVFVDNGENCACAIGVIYMNQSSKKDEDSNFEESELAEKYASKKYGSGYTNAFIRGFDKLPDETIDLKSRIYQNYTFEELQAYQDGVNCWEEVKHLSGYETFIGNLKAARNHYSNYGFLVNGNTYEVLEKRTLNDGRLEYYIKDDDGEWVWAASDKFK